MSLFFANKKIFLIILQKKFTVKIVKVKFDERKNN